MNIELTYENVREGLVIENRNNPRWGRFTIISKVSRDVWKVAGGVIRTWQFHEYDIVETK